MSTSFGSVGSGAGIDARTTQSPAHREASPECFTGWPCPPAGTHSNASFAAEVQSNSDDRENLKTASPDRPAVVPSYRSLPILSWIQAMRKSGHRAAGPAPFGTVCFPFRPHVLKSQSHDVHQPQARDNYLDRLNQALLDAVNASGEAFLSHTKINGRFAIRLPSATLAAIRLMSTAHGRCYAARPRVCMTKCADPRAC